MNLPLILQSRDTDGVVPICFRRINADFSVECKYLGCEWHPREVPTIEPSKVASYVKTLKKCGWKIVAGGVE